MADTNNSTPSFIPKKQVTSRPRTRVNAFSLASYVILFLVMMGAGLLYGANYWLEQDIKDVLAQVGTPEEAFPTEDLLYFRRIDTRATVGRELLEKNIRSSMIFPPLFDLTPVNVQYQDFSYSGRPGGNAELVVEAVTNSFGAAAFQFLQLQESEQIRSVQLDELGIEDNEIQFRLQVVIDFSEYSYFELN